MLNFDENGDLSYINAICFPHTCKTSDIKYLMKKVLNVKENFTIPEKDCITKDSQIWTPTDWGALYKTFFS